MNAETWLRAVTLGALAITAVPVACGGKVEGSSRAPEGYQRRDASVGGAGPAPPDGSGNAGGYDGAPGDGFFFQDGYSSGDGGYMPYGDGGYTPYGDGGYPPYGDGYSGPLDGYAYGDGYCSYCDGTAPDGMLVDASATDRDAAPAPGDSGAEAASAVDASAD